MWLCPSIGVRMVQLEYCCKSKLFAPSDDNLTPQNYKLFPTPQGFWRKKFFLRKKRRQRDFPFPTFFLHQKEKLRTFAARKYRMKTHYQTYNSLTAPLPMAALPLCPPPYLSDFQQLTIFQPQATDPVPAACRFVVPCAKPRVSQSRSPAVS